MQFTLPVLYLSLSHKKSQLNCRATVERPTRRKDSSVITTGDETISLQVASACIELNGKLFTHHQKGEHKKDLGHCLHFASSLY